MTEINNNEHLTQENSHMQLNCVMRHAFYIFKAGREYECKLNVVQVNIIRWSTMYYMISVGTYFEGN